MENDALASVSKIGVGSDVRNHFILDIQSGRGSRSGFSEFKGLIVQAASRVRLNRVIVDANYDSESNHQFAWEDLALKKNIPAKHGRPTDKPAKGHYRRWVQARFDEDRYRKGT